MNQRYTHFLAACLATTSLLLSAAVQADDVQAPMIKDGFVDIKIVEPARAVGYTVGDIVERNITLEVKKPYKLIETSLPIVGYEKRYKGQTLGVNLSSISHDKDEHDKSTTYHIRLAYQIFTNNVIAKHAATPSEYISLIADGKVARYRIPPFDFAVSPIAIFGQVKVENDMSDYIGPLMLDKKKDQLRLKVSLGLLGLSLLVLLYILGKHAWLPRMGGPFARAYRDLGKLPHSPDGLRMGISRLHESLNKTAGGSVFSDTLDDFIARKPAFQAMRADIERFFSLSRHVFFEPSAAHQAGDAPQTWLRQFCRRCRDCERGLTPEIRG